MELIRSSYRDNAYLNEDYSKLLETIKKTSPEYYRTFALGEYSSNEEIVYPNIKVVPEFPVSNFEERIYGLDFGYINYTALVQIDIKDNVYCVTELLYEKYMTNAELIEKMKKLKIKPDDYIYCDSAEPDKIDEIHMENFNAHAANKKVGAGIDHIRSCEIYTLFKNINFNTELENYSYKKDRDGRAYEEPEKLNDHLMDALRYAIFTHSKRVVPNVRFF